MVSKNSWNKTKHFWVIQALGLQMAKKSITLWVSPRVPEAQSNTFILLINYKNSSDLLVRWLGRVEGSFIAGALGKSLMLSSSASFSSSANSAMSSS